MGMRLPADRPLPAAIDCAVVAGLAALPYLQTLSFGFVNFDDPGHVADNPVVQQGLSRSGLAWACGLTGPVPDATWFNWPLAWLSHMADVSLFGTWAGGHHLVNVALHAVNAALVVAFVRSLGISASAATFCGVVFAVHPVQVESVAWISERKTLVSGCFMLLALIAYLTAGRRLAGSGQPSAAKSSQRLGRAQVGILFHQRHDIGEVVLTFAGAAAGLGGGHQLKHDQVGRHRHPHVEAGGEFGQLGMCDGVEDAHVFGRKLHRRPQAARRRPPVVAVRMSTRMLESGGQQRSPRNVVEPQHGDVDVERGPRLLGADLHRHAADQCVRHARPIEQIGHESQRPFLRITRLEAHHVRPQVVE